MIVLGAGVYAGLGLLRAQRARSHFKPVYAVLAVASVIVVAALSIATIRAVQLQRWKEAATKVGSTWARGAGVHLVDARFEGETLVMVVQGQSNETQNAKLPVLLHGSVPDGTPVSVDSVAGSINDVGNVTGRELRARSA